MSAAASQDGGTVALTLSAQAHPRLGAASLRASVAKVARYPPPTHPAGPDIQTGKNLEQAHADGGRRDSIARLQPRRRLLCSCAAGILGRSPSCDLSLSACAPGAWCLLSRALGNQKKAKDQDGNERMETKKMTPLQVCANSLVEEEGEGRKWSSPPGRVSSSAQGRPDRCS